MCLCLGAGSCGRWKRSFAQHFAHDSKFQLWRKNAYFYICMQYCARSIDCCTKQKVQQQWMRVPKVNGVILRYWCSNQCNGHNISHIYSWLELIIIIIIIYLLVAFQRGHACCFYSQFAASCVAVVVCIGKLLVGSRARGHCSGTRYSSQYWSKGAMLYFICCLLSWATMWYFVHFMQVLYFRLLLFLFCSFVLNLVGFWWPSSTNFANQQLARRLHDLRRQAEATDPRQAAPASVLPVLARILVRC